MFKELDKFFEDKMEELKTLDRCGNYDRHSYIMGQYEVLDGIASILAKYEENKTQ